MGLNGSLVFRGASDHQDKHTLSHGIQGSRMSNAPCAESLAGKLDHIMGGHPLGFVDH